MIINDTPWKHMLIDNFLSDEEYLNIVSEILPFYNKVIETNENLHIKANTSKIISDIIFPKLMNLFKTNFKQLNYGNKKHNFVVYPDYRINILTPGYEYDTIHPDANNKLMTAVLYLYPEKGDGTELYTDNNKESYFGSVEWKTNRVICFVSQNNPEFQKTWHSYSNKQITPRVTINMKVFSDKNFYD